MVFLRVENTMNGGSLGQRTSSTGSLHNGGSYTYGTSGLVRKPSKALISGTREKEKVFLFICQCLGRKKVAMLLLSLLPLLVFIYGSFSVNKESSTLNVRDSIGNRRFQIGKPPSDSTWVGQNSFIWNTVNGSNRNNKPQSPSTVVKGNANSPVHPCHGFAFPPPPPPSMRRPGLRACPVCYLPVKQAIASMPNSPSQSPVLRDLKYVKDENPIKNEPHGGSEFGGYPSLERRSDSFDIKESMNVHCGFVKGHKPGHQSGFDIDEADLIELEKPHDVIVASAIFGNYDVIQKPENISEKAKKKVPFYMFIDEETEAYMKNSSLLDDSRKVGIWRIILVHNTPYSDARRNGKALCLWHHNFLLIETSKVHFHRLGRHWGHEGWRLLIVLCSPKKFEKITYD